MIYIDFGGMKIEEYLKID